MPQLQQASANGGSIGSSTLDFLSLCGSTSRHRAEPIAARVTLRTTTQDFSHPLEEGEKCNSDNPVSHGFRTANTDIYSRGQEMGFSLDKEHLESLGYWSTAAQMKFGQSDSGYGPRTTSSHSQAEICQQHASSLNKQLQHACLEHKTLKVPSEDDEDDNGDQMHDQRKGSSFQMGDTSQKWEGKGNDNKGITPRSKHSATEQRRRSKINDRFQMLRQLVPNHDQKRDKASFLLEVIEYIQFLQEKVKKCEVAEHAQQQERVRNILWDVGQKSTGVHGSTLDTACADSLVVYGEENLPAVSTVPFNIKQAKDESELMRPQLITVTIPSERDVSATELLSSKGHVSMYLDRSVQALQWDNITKPVSTTLTAQPSLYPSFSSTAYIPHTVSCPTLKTLAVEQTRPPIIKSKASSCILNSVGLPHFHASIPLPDEIMNISDEQWQLEHNIRKHESGQHNVKNRQSNKELQTINPKKVPALQISGTSFSKEVLNVGTTGTCFEMEASSSRQLLNAAITGTAYETHGALKVKSQENGKIECSGMEPLTIHGGVINVSSAYSQGLLDKLTWALQTTGLDLSQASISVQIDLGRQGEGMATTTPKVTSLHSEVSQQSQGSEIRAGGSQELEHTTKKPKIDVGS